MIYRYSTMMAAVLLTSLINTSHLRGQPSNGRIVFTKQSLEATAEHLVNDRKFGGTSVKYAIEYGDEIIPLIKAESEDFTQLDNRNSFWIAKVLGSIHSDLSKSILKELYGREDIVQRAVGAVGLAMQGIEIGPIDDASFLIKTAGREVARLSAHGPGETSVTPVEQQRAIDEGVAQELAIIALGYSKSEAVVPILHDALTKKRMRSDFVCEAVARIKSPKSIPVLQACLRDPEFHELRYAYRIAICLGDKDATRLAIERLGEDNKRSRSEDNLIVELRRVTGKSWWFGRYKKNWQNWWATEGEKWTIPEEFLADWDKQPPLY